MPPLNLLRGASVIIPRALPKSVQYRTPSVNPSLLTVLLSFYPLRTKPYKIFTTLSLAPTVHPILETCQIPTQAKVVQKINLTNLSPFLAPLPQPSEETPSTFLQ